MKIAIAGFGAEGISNYKYLAAQGGHEITIVDQKRVAIPPDVKFSFGEDVFENLNGFDMVMRSAGIIPENIKTDGKIWSATNEFFAKCPAPIIGVTGTKGKGTTTSLIAGILKAAGRTVHIVGNIGIPALDKLHKINAEDLVVYEMSSFQLWDIEKSPHIAVVLMIEPDHLDVHTDMGQYLDAKANIVKYQKSEDICIYNAQNEYSDWISQAAPAQKYRYGISDDGMAYVSGDMIFVGDQSVCPVSSVKLPGQHNLDNACAAISAAWNYVQDPMAIKFGISSFEGLPHRLKYVDEVNGVKFYDDSIATTPGSAVAAINSFTEPKILILGGSSKGATYHDVVKLCKDTDTKVVAVGEVGSLIKQTCEMYGVECHYEAGLMENVVATAATIAKPGSVVILSPAAASFDQYKNYADRGDKFIEAVGKLKNI